MANVEVKRIEAKNGRVMFMIGKRVISRAEAERLNHPKVDRRYGANITGVTLHGEPDKRFHKN